MIVTSQASVGVSAVKLVDVPPGPCTVTLSNTGTVAVSVGTANTVTATNGFAIPPNGVVNIPGNPGSAPVSLWGIAASGTNAVGVLVSSTG